jgi:alpha-glucosidase
MNYAGFTFPLWTWLRGYRRRSRGVEPDISSPVPSTTAALDLAWRAWRAAVPWAVTRRQYNALDSHDVPRIRTVVSRHDSLHRLAAVVQFTYPGIPAVYYGDEIGMENVPGLGERGCMVWDEARWDRSLLAFHQQLAGLRRASELLQYGGLQVLAIEEDTIVYQREGALGRLLVVAHRGEAPRPAIPIPVAHGGLAEGLELTEFFSGRSSVVESGHLPIPEQAQGATIWIAERDGLTPLS